MHSELLYYKKCWCFTICTVEQSYALCTNLDVFNNQNDVQLSLTQALKTTMSWMIKNLRIQNDSQVHCPSVDDILWFPCVNNLPEALCTCPPMWAHVHMQLCWNLFCSSVVSCWDATKHPVSICVLQYLSYGISPVLLPQVPPDGNEQPIRRDSIRVFDSMVTDFQEGTSHLG